MIDEPSIQRFYDAQERREIERQNLRTRLANAASLSEYIEIKYADRAGETQQTANMGYSALKKRR